MTDSIWERPISQLFTRRKHGDRQDEAGYPDRAVAGTYEAPAYQPPAKEAGEGEGAEQVFVAPVWGYRGWRMDDSSPVAKLGSYRTGAYTDRSAYFWRPGVNVATCNREKHAATAIPVESCSCGFYALRDPFAVSYGVLGGVVGWGRVIDGEEGWRAEKVAIAALYDRRADKLIREIADLYEVPICSSLDDLAVKTNELADWMGGADLLDSLYHQGNHTVQEEG